jgi:hypothetical protein
MTEIESGIIDSETYRMRNDNMRKKARYKLKRVSIPPERGISEGNGRVMEGKRKEKNAGIIITQERKKENIVKLVTGTIRIACPLRLPSLLLNDARDRFGPSKSKHAFPSSHCPT